MGGITTFENLLHSVSVTQ